MTVPDDLRRYVAPAAFLLAVTVAVVLIHSGMHSGGTAGANAPTVQTTTHKVVAAATTTTTKKKHGSTGAAKQYWTVKAGDTFGVIASQSGVSVATIEQLNPNVSSTALFIGEKIRTK